MSVNNEYEEYRMTEWLDEYVQAELQRMATEPAFLYLAHNGDAIEKRVRSCLRESEALLSAGFAGAAVVRAAAGIEITIRFFLARPLVQGAFLSDEWSSLLSQKVLNGRTTEDRELLPAILRNWGVEITAIVLPGGGQAWEAFVSRVWPLRNDYVHKAATASTSEAELAIAVLRCLSEDLVKAVACRLGFTLDKTGMWSVVAVENPPEYPDLNPPREYEQHDPF